MKHAKGSGAYGRLTITQDITNCSKTGVFEASRQTRCFMRYRLVDLICAAQQNMALALAPFSKV